MAGESSNTKQRIRTAEIVGVLVQHIYDKVGVRSRAAATVWAYEHDLLQAA